MSITRTLAVALAIAAVGVSTAQARPGFTPHQAYPTPAAPSEDGPRNYSMNSATGEYSPPGGVLSAAADAGDKAAGPVRGKQDIRMPDTIDAAKGRGPADAPEITVVKVPTPVPAPASSSDGIDWADAGIGAGGALAMLALAGGGAFAVVRKRTLRTVA